jgi:hypothetical protein
MQDFKPECICKLVLVSRNRGGPWTWYSEIYDQRGTRFLVGASGRVESGDPLSAQFAGLDFVLGQLNRLKQEKVELSSSFPLGEQLEPQRASGRNGRHEIGWEKYQEQWQSIRLRRWSLLDSNESALLIERRRGRGGRRDELSL